MMSLALAVGNPHRATKVLTDKAESQTKLEPEDLRRNSLAAQQPQLFGQDRKLDCNKAVQNEKIQGY